MRYGLKKLFVFLFLFAAFAMSAAPVLVISQKPTLSWNAVTTDVNGNALPSGGTMTYDILWQPVGGGTAIVLTTGVTTTSIQLTSLALWTFYDLGVRASFTFQGATLQSAISWGSAATSPFTLLTGTAPSSVGSIKVTP